MNFEVKIPLLEANREKPTTDQVLGDFRTFFLEPDPQWVPEPEPEPVAPLAESPSPEGDPEMMIGEAGSESRDFDDAPEPHEPGSSVAIGDEGAWREGGEQQQWTDDEQQWTDDEQQWTDDEQQLPEDEQQWADEDEQRPLTNEDDDVVSYGQEQPLFSEERFAGMSSEPIPAESAPGHGFVLQDTVAEYDPQQYWNENAGDDEAAAQDEYLVDDRPSDEAEGEQEQEPIRRATVSYNASNFWEEDETAAVDVEDETEGLVPTPHDKPKHPFVEATEMAQAPVDVDDDRPITVDVPDEAPSINSIETDPNLFADAEPAQDEEPLYPDLSKGDQADDDDGHDYKVQQANKDKKKGGFFSMFRKKK